MLGGVNFREPWPKDLEELNSYSGVLFADTAIVTSAKANGPGVQVLYTLFVVANAWTEAANLKIAVTGL
jgi:hypothetical protein